MLDFLILIQVDKKGIPTVSDSVRKNGTVCLSEIPVQRITQTSPHGNILPFGDPLFPNPMLPQNRESPIK